jgi:hypothetical protein
MLDNIVSYLISPSLQEKLLPIKIVFILFGLFFSIGTIYFLLTTSWLRRILSQDLIEVLTYRPYWAKDITRKWKRAQKRLETDLESEYKLAVIEADSMLNDALQKNGYPGESLGERLEKVSKETLPTLNQIREVHKIRNSVVHDPDYKLTLREAKRALDIYENALHDLEAFG